MSLTADFDMRPMCTSSGERMKKSSISAGKFSNSLGDLSDIARDRLCAFLRRRHPVKTVDSVEADTRGRVKAATVRKWIDGASAPSFTAMCVLIECYGAELLVDVVVNAPQSIRDAANAERDMRYERRLAELRSEFNINA
jgi:hypothetical protein